MLSMRQTGYDQALAQHELLGLPTVVIPITLPDGTPGLYWESFAGLPEHLTGSETMQAAIATVCCENAYDDARAEYQAKPIWT